jgi:hypothetical protein
MDQHDALAGWKDAADQEYSNTSAKSKGVVFATCDEMTTRQIFLYRIQRRTLVSQVLELL